MLLAGKLLVAWDELHVVQGKTLAAILTAEVYSGRILGVNKLATVRNKLVQIALGNNVEVRGDLKRRVVPSRLVPAEAHPEHRDDFRHPDLKAWVRENRGELLAAAYTLWRNWIAKGRQPATVTLGSFEHWARTVGGVLHAAGIPGFLSGTAERLSYSEDDDGGWPAHLASLHRYFGSNSVTASAITDAVNAGNVKRPPVKRDPDKDLALQIANAYRGQREKWQANGLRLVRSNERDSENGSYTWSVRARDRAEGMHKPPAEYAPAESPPVAPAAPEQQVRGHEADGADRTSPELPNQLQTQLQPSHSSKTAVQRPPTGAAGATGGLDGRPPAPVRADTPVARQISQCIAPGCPRRARNDCVTCWEHADLEPCGEA